MSRASHSLWARLAAVVVAGGITLAVARPAHAVCHDLGGLGVLFGAAGGGGATLVAGFVFPAIAVAAKPGLKYWPGVGYTMAAGALGTLVGAGAVTSDCPFPDSLYVPSLVAVPLSAVTTVVWAGVSKPEPPPVALSVSTPRDGQGALLSVAGRF